MTDTKPLTDKQRAILLTNLGLKNIKGLRKWRDRLDIAPPIDPSKPPAKPRTRKTYGDRYGRQVRCNETGRVFPSYEAVVREYGGSVHRLKQHLIGYKPTYFDHTFHPVRD
jgi:hypothetical protein